MNGNGIQSAILSGVVKSCTELLSSGGFECHGFSVGDYNDLVAPNFALPYYSDCLAILVISQPQMFELTFRPWLSAHRDCLMTRDPLDQCMREKFTKALEKFKPIEAELIQDFELTPTRRPKLLMQTAGYVSGATAFYQRTDLSSDPWPKEKKIMGVCVHPNYGGWFAFRAVVIFPKLKTSAVMLSKPPKPEKLLKTDEEIFQLLNEFNFHWQKSAYRDMGTVSVIERYSESQQLYFNTKPADRFELIQQWWNEEDRGVLRR